MSTTELAHRAWLKIEPLEIDRAEQEQEMGTWGYGSFENDGACDWAFDLESHRDLSLIDAALEAAMLDDLEAPEGETALAACEVLASLLGRPSDGLPKSVTEWVAQNPQPVPEAMRDKAQAALDRITQGSSELRELWEESGELDAWLANVRDLRARLC